MDKYLYLLLKLIKRDGNVRIMINEGLSYKQIAQLTNDSIENGYILVKDNSISLTEGGETKLLELGKAYKKRNKNEWIKIEESSRIPPLDENFIFLPNQQNLKL
jgi:hypothetical protein